MLNMEIIKSLQNEQEQQTIRKGLSKIFKNMGFHTVAEEILNNRFPKTNALRALELYTKKQTVDRNTIIEEVTGTHPNKQEQNVKSFENELRKVIELLEYNTENQRRYLSLKCDYMRTSFNLIRKLESLSSFLMELDKENNNNWKKELEVWQQEVDKLEQDKKISENKLDNFVMSNLV